MSLPPGAPPPAPAYPPGAPPPPPPPPAAIRYASPGTPPGRTVGKASPSRLIAVFVILLVIALALGAVVVLAFAPGPKQPTCPDPTQPCAQPPVVPTLPPVAEASPSPVRTPAPTIVRPSGSLSIPSARPSLAATPAATQAPGSGSPEPSAAQVSVEPSLEPSTVPSPVAADLPQPQPPSNAERLRVGQLWTSSSLGFQLEYDSSLWKVDDDTDISLVLSAGHGAVQVAIQGFPASKASTKQLVQQQINSLADQILGLEQETDPERQLPGEPIVGYRQGVGSLLNGTLNSPQGPTAAVDVVILAASDSQISIRITVIAVDDLRDAAFSVVDTLNNSIEWPSDLQ